MTSTKNWTKIKPKHYDIGGYLKATRYDINEYENKSNQNVMWSTYTLLK